MKFRYILLAATMLTGVAQPVAPAYSADPVLFIGEPCSCVGEIHADVPKREDELLELLSEREYRWVVVFEPVENRQELAAYLIRTQPQAQVVLMEDEELAAKYRLAYVPDCGAVVEMLKKDRELGWKSGF